jgi:hypothetical protein
VVEQRLHDAPGLLDAVLPGEVLVVADHRGMQQHPLWLRRLAELAGELISHLDRFTTELEAGKPDSRPRRRRNRAWRLPPRGCSDCRPRGGA